MANRTSTSFRTPSLSGKRSVVLQMPAHRNRPDRFGPGQFGLRHLELMVAIAALICVLLYSQYQTQSRIQPDIDEIQQRINQEEPPEESEKRRLVGQFKRGDRISRFPAVLPLADYELNGSRGRRLPFLRLFYGCTDWNSVTTGFLFSRSKLSKSQNWTRSTS